MSKSVHDLNYNYTLLCDKQCYVIIVNCEFYTVIIGEKQNGNKRIPGPQEKEVS